MAKLVFHSGAYQGKRVTLPPGKSITLGRNRDIDLPLPDPKLSRKHCLVVSRQDDFFIRDLNSTNGTFVNGTRLSGEYQLKPFDRIVLGDIELEFLDEQSARVSPVLDANRTAVAHASVKIDDPPPASAAAAAPAADTKAPHVPGSNPDIVIESSDLLADVVEDAPSGDGASGTDAGEGLGDLEEVAEVAEGHAGEVEEVLEEPVEEGDTNADDQIVIPVPTSSASGRRPQAAAPGFLAPPAAKPAASQGDDLDAALYELSQPLPPEPPPLADTEARPKVLFCDGCDASIPLLDWDLNFARSVNGKMYCRECLPNAAPGTNGSSAPDEHSESSEDLGEEIILEEEAPAPAPAPAPKIVPGRAPAAASARPAPQSNDNKISDILAGLDQEAEVVDTTIKRRGQVIDEQEISKSLQTLEKVQQSVNANGTPAPARASQRSGMLGPGGVPLPPPAMPRPLASAPRPASAPAAAPARPTSTRAPAAPAAPASPPAADPLLDDLEEIG